jgi:class 3 adenylate cyclase/predicted ATPase
MNDIRRWLASLDLSQYGDVFAANDIDLDVVRLLSETDLEKLGLSLGQRKRFLKAAAALDEPTKTSAQPSEAPTRGEPERRQLTVMFCDLVGSTDLSAQLDPEDLRDIIGRYQNACAAVIHDVEGHVAKYMGDGILAYFGYPRAHEDDADRAVHAGLRIVEAVAKLEVVSVTEAKPLLAVRIGIATGEVVVGDMLAADSSREAAVTGETPNRAARLQGAAAPNQVLVGDRTRQLTRRGFDWSGPLTLTLKGFDQPVRAWRVGGERSQPLAAKSTRLIGRRSELALIAERLDAARSGDGQVVLLVGEAGIGKSRLTAAFLEQVGDQALRLQYFCSPFHSSSELKPFADQIEREAGIVRTDSTADNLNRVAAWLARYDENSELGVALCAGLLSLRGTADERLADLAPRAIRAKTLDLLEEHLLRLERRGPLVLVFEDLHWIDPTSAELLRRLTERVHAHRVLILANARPEFDAPWMRPPRAVVITLSRFAHRDAAALIEEAAGGRKLPPELVQQLLARGQGSPLFIEELTKSVTEALTERNAGSGLDLDTIRAIPVSLRDSLMARLDRLGSAKEIAQVCAVIGHDFDERLLPALIEPPGRDFKPELERLIEAQIIQRKPGEASSYLFRHALIQEAAYQSLLRMKRRDYHRKIAESLERGIAPELSEREPERVAFQYAEAALFDRAVQCWHRAATRAAERSANIEAVNLLREALNVARLHFSGEERTRQELPLLIALGPCLMATEGWNAPEVRSVYEAAIRLAHESGRAAETFPAIWGRWLTAHAGGEAESARELLRQLFDVIGDGGDAHLALQAHHAGASTMCTDGELAATLKHVEATLALYDLRTHRHEAMRYGGHDPCVCTQCIGALAEMMLGHTARAHALSHAAQALAIKVDHAPSVAHGQWYRVELCQILDDPISTTELADNVLKIGVDKGMSLYVAWATMARGWARAKGGDRDRGLGEMEDGVAALRATGVVYHLPHRLGMRAQTLALAGRQAAAIEAIEEAVASVEATGERWYEAEILRLKALLVAAAPAADFRAAERCLEQAIATASRQSARLWESRARLDLALLLARQNRDARTVVGPVVAWDDIDLPERERAKAMLEKLAG